MLTKKELLYYKTYLHPTNPEWMVLIHGAGGSSAIWFKQIKEFRKSYNLLLIDLRGHGKSSNRLSNLWKEKYTFPAVTRDIIQVLDHLKIEKAHFMAVSLGTILVRQLAEMAPERVQSMIMAGAVTRLNVKSRVLVTMGNTFKSVIPYMWLYKLFAWVIMPRKRHSESRNLFVREAKRLCQKEFIRWFKLTGEVNPLLRYFKEKDLGIPTLYIMGDEDFMFLKPVKKIVAEHTASLLKVVQECGHVVNVEQPQVFNELTLEFLNGPYANSGQLHKIQ
jgi:pimeloyl-ACP methyl ester carboxylesterase